MNEIERKIEEALMRHSTDVRPEPGAWNEIESRVRRSSRARAFVAGFAAAAVIATGAVVIPRLVGDDGPSTPPVAGSPTPSGSVTPATPAPPATAIPAGWTPLRHETDGYWLALPADWKTGFFEGHTSFRPPGLRSAEEGSETFTVDVFLNAGSDIAFAGTRSETTIAGRTAERWESGEGDEHGVAYEIPWDGCYVGPSRTIPCDDIARHLVVNVRASTLELWEQYGETGDRIARSIRQPRDAMPAGGFRTVHGSVAAGVAYDQKLHTVIQFMEARVFGDMDSARQYLTGEAFEQYESHEGGLDLYDPESSRGLTAYTIRARAAADANSDEFEIGLDEHSRGQGKAPSKATETLGVGAGMNWHGDDVGPVIRFATRKSA